MKGQRDYPLTCGFDPETYRIKQQMRLAAIVSAACDKWLAKHENRCPTDFDRLNQRKYGKRAGI